MWLYNATLARLSAFPENSVYRQSTEALTRQRLRTVASVEPAGFQEYKDRIGNLLGQSSGHTKQLIQQIIDGKGYEPIAGQDPDEREVRWNGERVEARTEGPATARDLETMPRLDEAESKREEVEESQPEIEHEPQLTAEQWVSSQWASEMKRRNILLTQVTRVSDLERQLSAGLIEEVVEVAKGELDLVDSMKKARMYVSPLTNVDVTDNSAQMGRVGRETSRGPMAILRKRYPCWNDSVTIEKRNFDRKQASHS